MGGMDLWVSYPLAFKQLDDYINRPRSAMELDALVAQFDDPHPAFAPTVAAPIGLQASAQPHFLKHWVGNPPLHGGAYWPYLTDIDVGGMLACAFQASVRMLAGARRKRTTELSPTKYHATLWTCSQEVPPSYKLVAWAGLQRFYKVPKQRQEKLFRIAVIQLDHIVLVLISTPEPLFGESGALDDELEVAYPIPHYRLRTRIGRAMQPCEWIQYAHPMLEPWPMVETEEVTFGDGPDVAEYQLTVPGRQRIEREPGAERGRPS
jgi:hypothetical protein